ncbi:MAG: carboxypeptidase-like regulatory domain-containing protein [Bryobacterales bacterium]|nr:carboxypeptidase-like regulatory domain-containing protein [Bryobacterales bacterium]
MIRVHPWLILLACSVALAAIDGTVVNRTTGTPQANAPVSLVEIGQAGMNPLADTKTDAQGRFRFQASPTGPLLLQTTHQGVSYSAAIQPGAPATGVELVIFDATRSAAEIAQHVILLEPSEKELALTESFFFNNQGKTTYHDAVGGTVQIMIPDAAKDAIQVTATGPSNLPLQRSAEKTGKPNTYKIDFPIKPGETRIDVNYRLPFTGSGKFATRLLHKEMLTRLVVPQGVEIKGAGLEELGPEPRSQARIFGVKGPSIEVEIQGTGSIRAAATAPEDDESGPGIKQILPRIYDRVWPIVGIAVAILALGFVMLYRRAAPAQPAASAQPGTPPRGKRRA